MAKANKDKLVFEKHDRNSSDLSSVWQYFNRSTDRLYAECQTCKKVLKHSGSTTTLHNHLKLKHSINLKIEKHKKKDQPSFPSTSQQESENSNLLSQNVGSETCKGESKNKKMKIEDFFKVDVDDVQSVVSKLTALDGLPFRVFCTSETLRMLFTKSKYDLPQSPNAVKTMVMNKCTQLKSDLRQEIHAIKAKGYKFSVSLDEWSSARNRRYVNVNIHSPRLGNKPFRNLGLSRITGRGTAENCRNILEEKLFQFGLSLEDDIACIVTDGASVMRTLGLRASAQSQLCLAHGIQCAVLDVLYRKESDNSTIPSTSTMTAMPHSDIGDNDSDVSESSSENEDGFSLRAENTINVPLVIYKDLIQKVRQIVKYFKNSPTRTDILNIHLGSGDKSSQLILDCKTRWSSLADMITRFLLLKDGVMKALIDLKNLTTFTNLEIDILTDLSISLNIIKATVEAICREDANLLTAETALKFMISKLIERDSTISRQLVESLKKRILQRRQPEIVGTLKYLHNPANFYAEDASDLFINPSNDIIIKFIIKITKKYFCQNPTVMVDKNDDDDLALIHYQQQKTSDDPLSFSEQIKKKIEMVMSNSPNTSTASAIPSCHRRQGEDLETICKVQMALFDSGGPRSDHLNKVYEFLMTIPPTSVEAERVFSSAGNLCNKLRTSLNDATLDCLSFLKSHYQRIKN